jgi:hypothetical protein
MDVTLKNGKTITFDLYSFTFEEYTKIFTAEDENVGNELIARAAGITVEEYMQLPYPDNRKVYSMFFKLCREVMSNPNSESVPTSV